ncbi:MAG: hypothetical protein WD696_07670 [Bryobacteraceae bacterium]
MTITVTLTAEEEAKLIALADGRGVSPDALIRDVVKDIIEGSAGLSSKEAELRPDERERRIAELFDSFDSVNIPSEVSEDAFHRENWYR